MFLGNSKNNYSLMPVPYKNECLTDSIIILKQLVLKSYNMKEYLVRTFSIR